MKVHSGGTQLKLATAQAANLRIHIMVHSGVKPNKCDQCNFSTHKTAILRKHMKVISGEKSNKCHPCKFSTTQAANLRIHIWKHHGENPKKCYLYRLNSVFTMRCQIQETHQRILNQRLYCLPAWEKNKCKNVWSWQYMRKVCIVSHRD